MSQPSVVDELGGVPRILWMLWFQGWDCPPDIVQACRRSWERHNASWDIRLLDEHDAERLAPQAAYLRHLQPAAYSDVVRLEVLRTHGGVWVDATTFCMKPLDSWLDAYTASGFFAFRKRLAGFLMSNWFLAAAPHNVIVTRLSGRLATYWAENTTTGSYFAFHQIFKTLVSSDSDARAIWRATPSVSARGPHYFWPYGRRLVTPMSRRAHARIATLSDPLYKLTWKLDAAAKARTDSSYRFFLSGEQANRGRLSTLLVQVDRVAQVPRWAKLDARLRCRYFIRKRPPLQVLLRVVRTAGGALRPR